MKTSYQVSDASLKRLRALFIDARDGSTAFKVFDQWADQEGFSKYAYWDALEKACEIEPLLFGYVIRRLRDKQEKLDLVTRTFDMLKGESAS